MTGSLDGVQALAAAIQAGAAGRADQVQLVLLPPFLYLPEVQRRLKGSTLAWGAQNVSAHGAGAYTGEVSPRMLREFGCACVLVGHSERRVHFGESDTVVASKFLAARRAGLTPVLCVGESLSEREQGRTDPTLQRQLQAVIDVAGADAFSDAVVVYEPLWTFGTGRKASPEEAQAVHAFIRRCVAAVAPDAAAGLHIVYGGAMKRGQTQALLGMPDVDGGLLNGDGRNVDEFMAVALTAQRLARGTGATR